MSFINKYLESNILEFLLTWNFSTEEELLQAINSKITEHNSKITGKDDFYDSAHEDMIENLTKLRNILFCDIEKIPLLLNNKYSELVKWRLNIGK